LFTEIIDNRDPRGDLPMPNDQNAAASNALTHPIMMKPRRLGADWTLFNAWAPLPGLGAIAINALLLKGKAPVLVDTGIAPLGDAFIAQLEQEIDPAEIAWIWISHADVDHIGALQKVLDRAPKAKVVTGYLGMAKLGLLGFDMSRVQFLEPGSVFEAGGRRLHGVRPLYYDASETMGFFDPKASLLYTVDCFGAVLPAPVDSVEDVGKDAFRNGMMTWSSIDSPWLKAVDRAALGRGLAAIDRLAPKHLVSAHLPVLEGRAATLTNPIAEVYCHGAALSDPANTEPALAPFAMAA
jgi:flavorubredoxin